MQTASALGTVRRRANTRRLCRHVNRQLAFAMHYAPPALLDHADYDIGGIDYPQRSRHGDFPLLIGHISACKPIGHRNDTAATRASLASPTTSQPKAIATPPLAEEHWSKHGEIMEYCRHRQRFLSQHRYEI